MKRNMLLILLAALLITLVSCGEPSVYEAVEQEEPAVEHVQEDYEEEPPAVAVTPAPVMTADWSLATAVRDLGGREQVFAIIEVMSVGSAAIERYYPRFDMDAVITLGDPEAPDATLVSITPKYQDTQINVYTLGGANDGSVCPRQLPVLENIFSTKANNGIILLLSGFVDWELSPPQYRYPFKVTISAGGETTVHFPTAMYTPIWMLSVTHLGGWTLLDADDKNEDFFGNPIPQPVQAPERPNSVDWYTGKDFGFYSAWGPLHVDPWGGSFVPGIGQRLGGDRNVQSAGFLTEQQLLYERDRIISYSLVDRAGNAYFVVSNAQNENLNIVRLDADTLESAVVRTISEKCDRDNTLMPLPASDYFLHLEITRYCIDHSRLVSFSGAPEESEYLRDERIGWLFNPIVNPSNISERLLFGLVGSSSGWWEEPRNPRYIALLLRDNEVVNWFITDNLERNSYFINTFTTAYVIAGVSTDMFATPMPYFSSFTGETIEVNFPNSFVTYTFDFDAFSISAQKQMDASFREASEFLHATPDGCYELWRTHRRHFHETVVYWCAIFDTQTEQVIDFFNYVPERFHWISFTGNDAAAVISGQDIRIFDLATMDYRRVELYFGEEAHRWRPISYAWDNYRNQHILIDVSFGKYSLLFFDANGRFAAEHRTDIDRFGGRFYSDPVQMHIIDDGVLYISGSDGGFFIDLDTGEEKQQRYLPLERIWLERQIHNATFSDEGYWRGLEAYISNLLRHSMSTPENNIEVFELLLEAVAEVDSPYLRRLPDSPAIFCVRTETLHTLRSGDSLNIVRIPVRPNSDNMPTVLAPEPESRFTVYLTDTGILRLHRLEDDWRLSNRGTRVSVIRPLRITTRQGVNSMTQISADAQFFTDTQVEFDGNVITLTYYNVEMSRRIPFAHVIYRNEMLEVVSAGLTMGVR